MSSAQNDAAYIKSLEYAKLNKSNLMIDIETLDTASSAVVVSIGLVHFDIDGIKREDELFLPTRIQHARGRTKTLSTMEFWKKQPESLTRDYALGIQSITNPGKINTAYLLLKGYIGNTDGYIYCKGLNFDIPILQSLFHSFELPSPFGLRFRSMRCLRTTEWAWKTTLSDSGLKSYNSTYQKAAHGALMDAKIQTQNLLTLFEYAFR